MKNDGTVNRTPNPECPACQEYRQHTEEEFVKFHPLARTGKDKY